MIFPIAALKAKNGITPAQGPAPGRSDGRVFPDPCPLEVIEPAGGLLGGRGLRPIGRRSAATALRSFQLQKFIEWRIRWTVERIRSTVWTVVSGKAAVIASGIGGRPWPRWGRASCRRLQPVHDRDPDVLE